ncbi:MULTISPECIES: hypothetical protein [unclassified Anabaena]|uniref:hypothetical protein n=1 Tax=unclassified Anabaena TaxID=2619674 RepID=UPI0039C6168C
MKSVIKVRAFINRASIFALMLTSLLTWGCGITNNNAVADGLGTQTQISQNDSPKLPKAIADKILTDASQYSGVAISDLKITQVKSQTFSNPCRFNFGEICTQEYNPVPAWEVIVKVQNQSWTYHVNQSASQIVLDPQFKVDSGNTRK